MAKIVIGAHVSSSGGIFKAIERGEAIEAEAIQIFPSAPQMWRQTNHKPEAIAKFRELHAESTIGSVWLHNIYLANLAADTPEHLEKSIGAIVNALTVADAIGADGVVLHTGSHKGAGMDAVVDQVSEALTRILEEAPGNAILALENAAGQGGAIGKEFSELGMLIERVKSPRLQVCLDTCHTLAAGYDISTPEGVAATVAEFDSAIGLDRLAVLHANDSKMELGGLRDRHENIGEGFIGTAGFEAMLAHPAFKGKVLLLEVPGFPGDDGEKADGPDLENVNRLKKIRDAV
ncbi:MAG: deoxyribonuclease IV [Dehalococcoidia bacterium]|nr:deoxyribonuclease IV [Dehalococcoidia bacterium]